MIPHADLPDGIFFRRCTRKPLALAKTQAHEVYHPAADKTSTVPGRRTGQILCAEQPLSAVTNGASRDRKYRIGDASLEWCVDVHEEAREEGSLVDSGRPTTPPPRLPASPQVVNARPGPRRARVRVSANGSASVIGVDLSIRQPGSKGEVRSRAVRAISTPSASSSANARITGRVDRPGDRGARQRAGIDPRQRYVTFQSSSRVEGDVFHKSLTIEAGRLLRGASPPIRRSDVGAAHRQRRTPADELSGATLSSRHPGIRVASIRDPEAIGDDALGPGSRLFAHARCGRDDGWSAVQRTPAPR
jgi:hypothetical protein